MRKKTSVESQESLIASGWTVEASPAEPAEAAADHSRRAASAPSAVTVADDTDAATAEGVDDSETQPAKPQLSNAALVLLGTFGGLYLLYAWVWLSWAQYYAPVNANLAASAGALGGVAQTIVYWLTPLAPLLWFLTALLMNRGKKLRSLLLWLVIGAIVLIPLPVFEGLVF